MNKNLHPTNGLVKIDHEFPRTGLVHIPLHTNMLLLQIIEPHPEPGQLELQLAILPPQRGVVVAWGHCSAEGSAADPPRLVRGLGVLVGEGAEQGAAEAELLVVEDLHDGLEREALVLGRVGAGFLR